LVGIARLVDALCSLPVRGADLLQLQRWVTLNYLIGNADAHGKNLSVLVHGTGYRLAPFYDLLPAWRKVRAHTLADTRPTATERELLERMRQVFQAHSKHALAMMEGVA